MQIGIFTDTYFPQVSGVATSISMLKSELERLGHGVIIFTTTDPNATYETNVIRLPSIPFVAFHDRRVAISGANRALKIAKEYQLDIVHPQTEFSLGLIGRYVANKLDIPLVHTYHTMYERYLHYIAQGKLLKPEHVRKLSRFYCDRTFGVIVPSELTKKTLESYGVKQQIFVIPTGVPLPAYDVEKRQELRTQLGYTDDDIVLLSLSRLSSEKNIDTIIRQFPTIQAIHPSVKLLVVGDGPDRDRLQKMVADEHLTSVVQFTLEIPNKDVYRYYQASDLYVNTSDSETQGLTYIEAIANELPVIAKKNTYLETIVTARECGRLFEFSDSFGVTVAQYITEDLAYAKTHHDARDAIRESISVEKFGKSVLEVYQQSVRNHQWFEEHEEGMLEAQKELFLKLIQTGRKKSDEAEKSNE